jgi:hypothetical protein
MSALESDLGALLCLAFPVAFPSLLIFRRQILNVETKEGWRARAGVKGQADYYVMGKRVHVEVETKNVAAKWYAQQVAWRARCAALEIPYLVARARMYEEPDVTVARWIEEIRGLI